MENSQVSPCSPNPEKRSTVTRPIFFELINQILEDKFLNVKREGISQNLTSCFPFLQSEWDTLISLNLFYEGVKIDHIIFETLGHFRLIPNRDTELFYESNAVPSDFPDNISNSINPIFRAQSENQPPLNGSFNLSTTYRAILPKQDIVETNCWPCDPQMGNKTLVGSMVNKKFSFNGNSSIQLQNEPNYVNRDQFLASEIALKSTNLSVSKPKDELMGVCEDREEFIGTEPTILRKNKQFSLISVLNERKRKFMKVNSKDQLETGILKAFKESREVLGSLKQLDSQNDSKSKPDYLTNEVPLTENTNELVPSQVRYLKEHWTRNSAKFAIYLFKKRITLQTNSKEMVVFEEIELSKKWVGKKRIKY